MRVVLIIVLISLVFAGCQNKSAQPPIKIVFFFDDGTSRTETIAFSNMNAADAIIRPILASAFTKPKDGPRVVRWLLEDKRSCGPSEPVHGQGAEAQMRATVSIYRDYRFVPAPIVGPAIPWIQLRERPNGVWKNWAEAPDPEMGLKHAIYHLVEDLKSIRELADVSPSPAR